MLNLSITPESRVWHSNSKYYLADTNRLIDSSPLFTYVVGVLNFLLPNGFPTKVGVFSNKP